MNPSGCTLCAALVTIPKGGRSASGPTYVAGFLAGTIGARTSSLVGRPLLSFLCLDHVRELRTLAESIPNEVLPSEIRTVLLNDLHLSAVAPRETAPPPRSEKDTP